MHHEEEYKDSQHNRQSAASVSLVNPVEVEVTNLHDFLYQSKNPQHMSSEEKKPGFWKSIFGEKKCKICSRKKCECTCKSEKKKKHRGVDRAVGTQLGKYDQDQANPGSGAWNCSAYGTSKEVQKNTNCPTKCNLPMNQGCGCHLYFCIDSKRKKPQIKSKNNKNKHNEKMKTERKPFTQLSFDENNLEEVVPNVTIYCDESKDDLGSPQNYVQTTNNPTSNINNSKQTDKNVDRKGTRPFNVLAGEKTIFQFTNFNKNFLDSDVTNKLRSKDIETNTENKFVSTHNHSLFGSVVKEENVYLQQSISANKLPKKVDILDNNKFDQNQSLFEDINKGVCVLRTFTEDLHKDKTVGTIGKTENNTIGSSKSNKSLNIEKKLKYEGQSGKDSDMDSYAEEYNNFSKNRKKTRKSTAKSLFAKNSLITLRRERRQSEFEGRVSLIIDKLGAIENKITELEKMNNVEQGNKITMGILSEGKQSKVSIKFNNKSGKEIPENQENFIGISQSGEKSNKIIRITSKNESIYLKTPGEVKVVRSKQQEEDPSNRSKQLIYENAYKMDAHTIGSNSTTIKCKNPKLVLSYPKPEPFCKNPNCSKKWRRISEELKKSNLDVVTCETCGRKS